ncbi:MAG TPA: Maf family protein [Candidatus Krumholzibacterium sp.]|nr:Maf family protein [Candidatus Krumholzibacterium sp.]
MNPFLSHEVQNSLVLASASPRRREILEGLGFEFEVIVPDVDEDVIIWKEPEKVTSLLSELKAVEVQSQRPRKTIIGADTVVILDGEIMGKPAGRDDAVSMIRLLSGRSHEVMTAITIAAPPNIRITRAERTRVIFRKITDAEIERYADMDEPYDKAGGYAVQGHASVFVDRIEGCYPNVVGLPVSMMFRMFRELESMKRL